MLSQMQLPVSHCGQILKYLEINITETLQLNFSHASVNRFYHTQETLG